MEVTNSVVEAVSDILDNSSVESQTNPGKEPTSDYELTSDNIENPKNHSAKKSGRRKSSKGK